MAQTSSRPTIIGISGRARAGKDTIAALLAESLGSAAIIGFADPMRRFMADLFGFDVAEYEKMREDPETAARFRGFMQRLSALRDVDPGIYASRALLEARRLLHGNIEKTYRGTYINTVIHRVIIKDVRFPDEAEAIKKEGGVLIFKEGGVEMDHPSEKYATSGAAEREADFVVGWRESVDVLRCDAGILSWQI